MISPNQILARESSRMQHEWIGRQLASHSCQFVGVLFAFIAMSAAALAVPPKQAKEIHDRAAESLVAVQYTWAYEFGRVDFVLPGVVVRDDGLIALPLQGIGTAVPDTQLVDFKIIIPHKDKDQEELDAVFQGRDERTQLAFVKPRETGRTWKALAFEDAPIEVGDETVSIAMLTKDAGYSTYFIEGRIAAKLRGEQPTILASALGAIGAPVFNADGKAIGLVCQQVPQQPFLYTSNERRNQAINTLASIQLPPTLFVPTSDFSISLKDPPTAEKPLKMPWIGTPGLTGLEKDVAEAFGLENQPAIEIGDIIPGSPAEKAGLKVGQKIVKLNGQALERGDQPEELPLIFARNVRRLPVDSEITLSVLTEKDKPLQDVKLKLEERPKRQHEMRRFWADDLGFSTRDVVFDDTYSRKQPADLAGVVVALVKREGAAGAARLENGDIITSLNGEAVKNLEEFEKSYQTLRKDKPKEPIVLVVLKFDATTQTVKIEPPQ